MGSGEYFSKWADSTLYKLQTTEPPSAAQLLFLVWMFFDVWMVFFAAHTQTQKCTLTYLNMPCFPKISGRYVSCATTGPPLFCYETSTTACKIEIGDHFISTLHSNSG